MSRTPPRSKALGVEVDAKKFCRGNKYYVSNSAQHFLGLAAGRYGIIVRVQRAGTAAGREKEAGRAPLTRLFQDDTLNSSWQCEQRNLVESMGLKRHENNLHTGDPKGRDPSTDSRGGFIVDGWHLSIGPFFYVFGLLSIAKS